MANEVKMRVNIPKKGAKYDRPSGIKDLRGLCAVDVVKTRSKMSFEAEFC